MVYSRTDPRYLLLNIQLWDQNATQHSTTTENASYSQSLKRVTKSFGLGTLWAQRRVLINLGAGGSSWSFLGQTSGHHHHQIKIGNNFFLLLSKRYSRISITQKYLHHPEVERICIIVIQGVSKKIVHCTALSHLCCVDADFITNSTIFW